MPGPGGCAERRLLIGEVRVSVEREAVGAHDAQLVPVLGVWRRDAFPGGGRGLERRGRILQDLHLVAVLWHRRDKHSRQRLVPRHEIQSWGAAAALRLATALASRSC